MPKKKTRDEEPQAEWEAKVWKKAGFDKYATLDIGDLPGDLAQKALDLYRADRAVERADAYVAATEAEVVAAQTARDEAADERDRLLAVLNEAEKARRYA